MSGKYYKPINFYEEVKVVNRLVLGGNDDATPLVLFDSGEKSADVLSNMINRIVTLESKAYRDTPVVSSDDVAMLENKIKALEEKCEILSNECVNLTHKLEEMSNKHKKNILTLANRIDGVRDSSDVELIDKESVTV